MTYIYERRATMRAVHSALLTLDAALGSAAEDFDRFITALTGGNDETSARFRVVTCTGYRTARKGNYDEPPGCEAIVIDSLWNCAAVASFQSEQRNGRQTLGVAGAVECAEVLAAILNRREGMR